MTDASDTIALTTLGPGPTHSQASVWLPQLYLETSRNGVHTIEDRVFVECVLEGPAVILPIEGCHFDDCYFGDHEGDPKTLMLAPLGAQKVLGVIPFRNCRFERCRFVGVGFTGGPDFLTQLAATLKGPAS